MIEGPNNPLKCLIENNKKEFLNEIRSLTHAISKHCEVLYGITNVLFHF